VRTLLAGAICAAPAWTLACASCARDNGPYAMAVLAAMVLFPFAVAGVVIHVLRRSLPEDGR
jgi:hypothetical protein